MLTDAKENSSVAVEETSVEVLLVSIVLGGKTLTRL